MCSEDQSVEENEVQLLYRVPIFDPFEFSVNPVRNDDDESNSYNNRSVNDDSKTASYFSPDMNHLEGNNILPSELDLAEFAADVESLLGKGLEDESFDMEELGLLDMKLESRDCSLMLKVKDEETGEVPENHRIDMDFDLGRETFELNLDFGSCEEDEEEEEENKAQIQEVKGEDSSKTFLKLDYEAVMSAWDDQKSPWTTGERPDLNSADCWPQYLDGTSGSMQVYGVEMGVGRSGQAWGDGGREARVMRYREKRRTRLFSKKIRYEVRKLNAEKRPRMKGRFVKRTSFAASVLNK